MSDFGVRRRSVVFSVKYAAPTTRNQRDNRKSCQPKLPPSKEEPDEEKTMDNEQQQDTEKQLDELNKQLDLQSLEEVTGGAAADPDAFISICDSECIKLPF